MPSFNQVILMGHLTRDPQTKFLANQTQVTEFGIANNRKFKGSGGEDREEVLFVDCVVFGRTAEVIAQHFTKGKPIFIVGRLKYDSWEDKNGGGKRSKLSVVVDNFQFIGAKDGAATSAPQTPGKPKAGSPPPSSSPLGEDHFAEADIPF